MPLLLDTHILLWALSDPALLKEKTRKQIEDSRQVVFVSAASLWEIAIKKNLGKLEAPDDIESVLAASFFSPLAISWAHAVAAGKLPSHHKGPFDRMLIAQAKLEGLTLLTHDRHLARYGSFIHLA